MFNSTNNTPFTMPVMPATGGYGNDGAFSDGGWLWIIVVFALLFGWGNNGFGGFGGNGGGYVATAATQADIQRGFDTAYKCNPFVQPCRNNRECPTIRKHQSVFFGILRR